MRGFGGITIKLLGPLRLQITTRGVFLRVKL